MFNQSDVKRVEEMGKYVRQHYRAPPPRPYEAELVTTRTEKDFVRKNTKLPWAEAFNHRKENLRTGHFSDIISPYKPLGEPRLDFKQFIFDTFGESLSGAPGMDFASQGVGQYLQVESKASSKDSLMGDKNVTLDEFNARKKHCSAAGMQDIRNALQIMEKRIGAVKAGQPYSRITRPVSSSRPRPPSQRFKPLPGKEERDSGMLLKNLSSHFLDISIPTEGLNMARLLATPEPQNVNEQQKLLLTHMAHQRRDYQILASQKNSRKVFAFQGKIQCIYTVLCCMYNMKARHLRMKATLTPAMLKEIRQDPFLLPNREKEGRMDGTNTSLPCSAVSTAKTSANTPISAQTMSRLDPNMRPVSSAGAANLSRKSISLVRQAVPNLRMIESKRSRKLTMTTPIQIKVETWDDLLNVNKKRPRERRLPIWQQQLPMEKLITNETSAEDVKDHKHLLNHMKMEELHLNEALRNQVLRNLIKIDEERKEKAWLCMEQLNGLKPLWEEQTKVRNGNILEVEAKEDTQVPPWYELLSKECTHLGCDLNPDIFPVLVKILKFTHLDLENLPGAREKLCLLTMSLPVMELCIFEMQTAIKFILREVIHHSPDQLDKWLHARKLYVI